MNSFFNSQFNYCPLIWMFHSVIKSNKINCLHERCLRLLYGDKSSSFQKLLEQDKSVTIHTRNLQVLATEIFKVYQKTVFARGLIPQSDQSHVSCEAIKLGETVTSYAWLLNRLTTAGEYWFPKLG